MCVAYAQRLVNKNEHTFDEVGDEILHAIYAQLDLDYEPQYNVWPGNDKTYLYLMDKTVRKMSFGFTPAWSKDRLYQFNARCEGDLNPNDDPAYAGPMGIFTRPMFRSAIKSRRAVLPVHYFMEGPKKEKLKKPHKIFHKQNAAFFVACIWETWTDKQTGETVNTFAICTTGAAKLLHERIGHHRSPLVLCGNELLTWLNPAATVDELSALMKPFNSDEYDEHPIAQTFKDKGNKADYFEPVVA
jgi:putative SOS response-associated peptidase YedK